MTLRTRDEQNAILQNAPSTSREDRLQIATIIPVMSSLVRTFAPDVRDALSHVKCSL